MIRKPWFAFAVAGVVTLAVYLPSLGSGFVWDDEANILGNESYRGFGAANLRWMFTAFHMGHYHPLTWVSLGLDHAIWGMRPVGYHLTNAILHALSAVVLAGIAARFLGRTLVATWFGAAVALAWSLHPLRVEAVSWVTQRREVLCGVLALLAIATRLRGRAWSVSAALALAAMLAKVTAVTLPFLFVLVDLGRSGGFGPGWPRRAWHAAVRHGPLFAIAGALVVVSFLAQKEANAIVSTEFLSVPGRLALYFFGVTFCTVKTFAPFGLAPLHQGQVGCTWDFQPFVWWWAAAGFAGAAIALVLGWRARARTPAAIFFVLAFLGLLVPAGGLGQSGPQIAAERYTYQPAWALTVGVALLLAMRVPWLAARRALAAGLAAVVIAALAVATVLQQRAWRDTESLWVRELSVHPDNAFSSFVLGYHYLSRDPPAFALAEPRLRNAVANLSDYVDARKALAGVLRATGRAPEAITVLEEFARRHPGNSEAYRLLAKAQAADGKGRDAVATFSRGVAAAPSPGLVSDFAWMLATDPDPAVRDGKHALELASLAISGGPPDARMAVMYAAACAEAGDFERGRRMIESAIASGVGPQEAALRRLLADLERKQPVRAPARFP